MAANLQQRALNAEEILAEVTCIVRASTAVDATRELPAEQPLVALGLDSLALVNAVAAVEAAFGSELPDTLWEDRRGVSLASLATAVASVAPSAPPVAVAAAPVSAASEQPGNSRVEPLFLRLEAGGPAGRAAAGALQRAVILAQWARARHGCVVLERDLTGELPDLPLPAGVTVAPYDGVSDAPLAGMWSSTQAARSLAHLRKGIDAGTRCLAAWENGRVVAFDMLARCGGDDVTVSLGTCFGLNLYERREARGRGIGLGLLAASLPYARDLGFSRQATIVLERNRPMIAAATQMLGFEVRVRAERSEMFGRVRWTWQEHGATRSAPRLQI